MELTVVGDEKEEKQCRVLRWWLDGGWGKLFLNGRLREILSDKVALKQRVKKLRT